MVRTIHSTVSIMDMSDAGTFVTGQYRVFEGPEYEETQYDIIGQFIWGEQHGFRDLLPRPTGK